MIDEAQIRRVVQDELQKSTNLSRFKMSNIPYHTHNGVDSQNIRQSDIIPSVSVSGSITFSQITTYTLQLNSSFTPSNILAYGIVTGDGVRCHTIGSANLGPSFNFQPGASTYVVTGGPQQNIIQGSSYMSVLPDAAAGGVFHALTSQAHIVDIEYPVATIHARATVTNFSKTAITISVPYLDAGWSIIVNWVVS